MQVIYFMIAVVMVMAFEYFTEIRFNSPYKRGYRKGWVEGFVDHARLTGQITDDSDSEETEAE